jgi:hypothetical protein
MIDVIDDHKMKFHSKNKGKVRYIIGNEIDPSDYHENELDKMMKDFSNEMERIKRVFDEYRFKNVIIY